MFSLAYTGRGGREQPIFHTLTLITKHHHLSAFKSFHQDLSKLMQITLELTMINSIQLYHAIIEFIQMLSIENIMLVKLPKDSMKFYAGTS